MPGEIPHNGPSDLTVYQCEVASVADILGKASHIRGQGLETIPYIGIDRHGLVKLRHIAEREPHPVVDASHVINKPRGTERGAGSKPVCPDEVTMDLLVMPDVSSQHEHVALLLSHLPVVFTEDLEPGAVINVNGPLTCVVIDDLALQPGPVAVERRGHKAGLIS